MTGERFTATVGGYASGIDMNARAVEVGPCMFEVEVEPGVLVEFWISESGFWMKRKKHEPVNVTFKDALAKSEGQLTFNLV
jgi:hypothetical protein